MKSEISFDQIRRDNFNNILSKVKSGKSLTAAETRTLNNEENRRSGKREYRTDDEKAAEYGISRQTIVRWNEAGAPFEDDDAMFLWMRKRQVKGALAWRRDYLQTNPEKDLRKQKIPKVKEISKELSSAEQFRDHYKKQLDSAIRSDDTDSIKFWNEHYLKIDESIRKTQLHAQKLGIDNGTTLPRAEVERILRAVFYAGNGCVNGALSTICEHLAGIADPAEIYHALKPAIVGGRLFSGFDKVTHIEGAPSLPKWVVECVQMEAEQYLENSESLWTENIK
tara:strand:- start:3240 stop:4082 length:843 start_codon:yes stop_codon:yes gene_type:complete